jgi:ABC-2 type transport system ATP-binding protein
VERLALEAVGISKRYGKRDALCRVNLIARPGQLHGLLGPNGAGKTTLMRVLLGLVRRDAGTVHFFGRSLDATAGRVPDGVAGFVETPGFYPYLSGRKNLALLARLDGDGGSRGSHKVDRVLEQAGLALQADIAVASYSAGMRQRLGLAAELLRSPRLLFLDEPTSFLDPLGARELRSIARRLADEGAAVVLSSHDMAEVEALCATLTVINHGCVVFSGTVDELRQLAPAAVHLLRTSDDNAALDVASRQPGVTVALTADRALEVSAETAALDRYVIALGGAGIAVRALEPRARSLESLFIELTGHGRGEAPMSASPEAPNGLRVSLAAP